MRKVEKTALKVTVRFCTKAAKTNSPLVLGVDSGSSGAVAMRCGDLYAVVNIPVIKVKKGGKNRTVFNLLEIVALFKELRGLRQTKAGDDRPFFAVLEEPPPSIGPGRSYANVILNRNYAMWPLFLVSQGYRLEEVRPAAWKKKMGLTGKDKGSSRYMAMKMFPKAPLARVKDHDRAEALLLSEYLKRTLKGWQ